MPCYQPPLAAALADHPRIRHIKIADGIGHPLGALVRRASSGLP